MGHANAVLDNIAKLGIAMHNQELATKDGAFASIVDALAKDLNQDRLIILADLNRRMAVIRRTRETMIAEAFPRIVGRDGSVLSRPHWRTQIYNSLSHLKAI